MAKKAEVVSVITPKGELSYPWLRTPDTRFNADGIYKCGVIVSASDAQGLLKRLEEELKKSYQEAVDNAKPQDKKAIKMAEPWKAEYDTNGDETGRIIINAKSQFKPAVFDAKNKPVPEDISPYGGSIGRMEIHVKPYYTASSKTAGLSMYLQAVQVTELVTNGGGGARSNFGEEEGYSAPTPTDPNEWTEDDDIPFLNK